MIDHSFVVPAYGCSPHLDSCLASLSNQSAGKSEVIVSSSTPSQKLASIAAHHGAQYFAAERPSGIGSDWNAALGLANRSWVTIAHQDDIYLPGFVARTMEAATASKNAALVFTGYSELTEGGHVRARSTMLRIKSLLIEAAFLGRDRITRTADKLRLFKLGCPIPCPSVTLGPAMKGFQFREDLKVDLDWEAWIRAARRPGTFVYVREILMHHRIHASSETSHGIRDGVRAREDREMFEALWPRPLAAAIARLYTLSYGAGDQ